MFSFGVLLLEVACRRRPVDLSRKAEESILVDWAWELYTEERLLEGSDPRLGMRHICQILEGEAPLPQIRWASMNVSIMGGLKDGLFGQCHMKESPVLSFCSGGDTEYLHSQFSNFLIKTSLKLYNKIEASKEDELLCV